MAEYKSIHRGEKIDEAVTRALNLENTIGLSSDKIMSQKAITEELENKMDKTEGKGLSSNDFTDEEKSKLAGIETGANKTIVAQELGHSTTEVISQSTVTKALEGKLGLDSIIDIQHGGTNATTTCDARDNLGVYSRNQVDEKFQMVPKVVQETGESTNKVMSQKSVTDKLESKVDKIEGKGLSSNDFTDELKNKLISSSSGKSYLISIDKVWSAFSDGTYMQIVPVNGIKETDAAVVCIETSKDELLADKELEIWNRITSITVNNGSITVYITGRMPDISIKIRIKT